MVELKEGWGRGVELRTSEEALSSQVRLLATHMEHAAEYALARISKLASANNQIRTTTYNLESESSH